MLFSHYLFTCIWRFAGIIPLMTGLSGVLPLRRRHLWQPTFYHYCKLRKSTYKRLIFFRGTNNQTEMTWSRELMTRQKTGHLTSPTDKFVFFFEASIKNRKIKLRAKCHYTYLVNILWEHIIEKCKSFWVKTFSQKC